MIVHPELTGGMSAHRQTGQEQQRNHCQVAGERQILQQEIQWNRRQRPCRTGRHRHQSAAEPEAKKTQRMPQQAE